MDYKTQPILYYFPWFIPEATVLWFVVEVIWVNKFGVLHLKLQLPLAKSGPRIMDKMDDRLNYQRWRLFHPHPNPCKTFCCFLSAAPGFWFLFCFCLCFFVCLFVWYFFKSGIKQLITSCTGHCWLPLKHSWFSGLDQKQERQFSLLNIWWTHVVIQHLSYNEILN